MPSDAEKRAALASRIRAKTFTPTPGVFDMISARIADAAGFAAIYMTGYGTVASHLGLPDAGIATYRDMLGRAETIARGTNTPLIADGDTGYGGLLNLHHTVRGYEDAGVCAIQLEDQEFPKKCGHTPGKRVVAFKEAVRRIQVAVEARRNPNFLIIARTDARAPLGPEEAFRRAAAFDKAGADIIFVEALEGIGEIERLKDVTGKPLLINNLEGGKTPILPPARLSELGYVIGLHPCLGFLAAGQAMRSVFAHLAAKGTSLGDTTPLHDFGRFSEMMGFPEVWAFDKKWAED
ncbi:MAG: isocitrate lyase/PEP mutase family protein [Alphaproteobacteria bacterium]|nr:isocitrate lyase/PEP mutase family protein [Alphaproteobacteria bacterium]